MAAPSTAMVRAEIIDASCSATAARIFNHLLYERFDGLACDGRGMCGVDLVELPSRVRPARGFDDPSVFVELLEACISISLKRPSIGLEMLLRPLALAVWRVREPYGWRGCVAGRAIIADIGPKPPRFRFTVAWSKHRDRRIVGVELGCRQDMLANSFDQRL